MVLREALVRVPHADIAVVGIRPQRLQPVDGGGPEAAGHATGVRVRHLVLKRETERVVLRIELVQIVGARDEMRDAVRAVRRLEQPVAHDLLLDRERPLVRLDVLAVGLVIADAAAEEGARPE